STLVTGPDIIFFWVARMIMAGYEYVGKMPFENVYFTGIVRDKIGRKMSKSLGNSPDPIELINTYGADGVRMGMMLAAPAGNDIMFDDKLCEQGRNFCNKIWNAFRLINGWEVSDSEPSETSLLAIDWFKEKLAQTILEVNDSMSKFRVSEALMAIYKLFWDEFSAWYLEMIKPAYGQPIERKVLKATNDFFDALLRLLHPFMPFITEELWQHLDDRREGESIMYAPIPVATSFDKDALEKMDRAKEIITGIRAVRASKNIPSKDRLKLNIIGDAVIPYMPLIIKLAVLESINNNCEKNPAAASFMVSTTEFNIPLEANIDVAQEIDRLEKELSYFEGFLASVMKKLGNEKFVNGAPAKVVEIERQKQADAQAKIANIKATLVALRK
ncbi:MAG: class I tRNA ligase family protein, partial [Muribaculaceae bacterium]|nr:class I tRNA ligase family protein [Muribaculaceae bacterium]